MKIKNCKLKIPDSGQRGATLIEVLIYILVFSFVMSAVLISVNQILSYSYLASNKSSIEQEAAFLMAKISSALNGASGATIPTANTLVVAQDTGNITITLDGTNLELNNIPINSARLEITDLNFVKTTLTGSVTVDTIKTSFEVEGKYFESVRTIR